jgi:hypothetical protein
MKRTAAILFCGLTFCAPASAQTTVIILKPTLPDLPGDAPAAPDTSPMVCRAPAAQTFSRLLGPRVCKTQRQWDDLHAKGLEIGADGNVVASEKSRTLNPRACGAAVCE